MDHFRLKRLVSSIRPDIMHAHYVRDYGFRAAETGFHPLVLTAWGSDILVDPVNRPLVQWELRRTLHKADLITCDASHIVPDIRRFAGMDADIRIINFGIDTGQFSPTTVGKNMRQSLDLEGRKVVVSTRSLRPLYDVATLIRAIPEVLTRVPHTAFIIIGDGPEAHALRLLAASLGVLEHIRFIGQVPNAALPAYLCAADIYVSTSRSDAGLAASTAEAMACSLPVVVSDFGDNPNWVHDGENGLLFPCGNHAALAAALVRVLTDEGFAATAGRANREIIIQDCDRDTEMCKMEGIYRELACRPCL